jgi:predicted nucleotidyltransferase
MIPRHTIRKFANEVARRFKPSRIILFGSYAYGRPTPDSDVDLLVVMSCKRPPLDAALDVRLAVDAGFPLDLIVRTPAQLRRRLALGDFFLHEIVDKGIVLYEAANG